MRFADPVLSEHQSERDLVEQNKNLSDLRNKLAQTNPDVYSKIPFPIGVEKFTVGGWASISEWKPGASLQSLIDQKIDPQLILPVLIEYLEIIEAVDQAGFSIEDIKPGNMVVFATASKDLKLSGAIDWDNLFPVSAKENDLRGRVGNTPEYNGPEKYFPKYKPNVKSALCSWANMLYESYTGETQAMIENGEIRMPDFNSDLSIRYRLIGNLPNEIAKIISECVVANPERRPQIREVIFRLKKYLQESL